MREKISLKVEGTVKNFVCFTKRTENVTLEMFSRQRQRKKSVEVLARQSSVSTRRFVPCGVTRLL